MNTVALLLPNPAQAERFLARFGPTDALHCFQTIDDGAHKQERLARTLHGPLAAVWRTLVDLNRDGAGVFYTPNQMTPNRSRCSANVQRVRACFADSDNPDRRLAVEAEIAGRGLMPSFMVESSPGKRHYYWLNSDCPLAGFKQLQKAIAAALGTDPSVCDLPRVMRLPGFVHRKRTPFLVREVGPLNEAVHTHAAMMAAYPPVAARQTPTSPARSIAHPADPGLPTVRLRTLLDRFGGLVTPAVQAAIAETQHGTRHLLMRAIVARLVPMRWPDADIRALVIPAATAAWPDVDPSELGERLDRLLSWVRSQEAFKLAGSPPATARAAALAHAFGASA